MKYKISLFILSLVLVAAKAQSQVQTIITLAGNGVADFAGDGTNSSGASLHGPVSVASTAGGDIYIADYFNNRVRKVAISGIITTVAGNGLPGNTGNGTIATTAAVVPKSIALDKHNNIFISDANSHVIRKVNYATGIISTVAGTGYPGFNGNGGYAINAKLNTPCGIAVDDTGNLYIADAGNHEIRKVDTFGIIRRVAGKDTSAGWTGDMGPAILARLDSPYAVAIDRWGTLYISDYMNQVIRMVDTFKNIYTIAGTPVTTGYFGDNGPAALALLHNPRGLAVDTGGNLYIADAQNNVIRKIHPAGTITTVVGNGTQGFGGDLGFVTGANLFNPYALAVDKYGSLYIADANNERVRKTYNPKVGVNTVAAANSGIAVYPNPFSDRISVSGLSKSDKVSVYNVVGQRVSNVWEIDTAGTQTFNINDLAAGVYTLQVCDHAGNRKATLKLVKE
jgi:Secretion system C-terminal sorting domain/NHL repeat